MLTRSFKAENTMFCSGGLLQITSLLFKLERRIGKNNSKECKQKEEPAASKEEHV